MSKMLLGKRIIMQYGGISNIPLLSLLTNYIQKGKVIFTREKSGN